MLRLAVGYVYVRVAGKSCSTLNRLLHVPENEESPGSVSGFRSDDQTVKFTIVKYIGPTVRFVDEVGERANEMYSVELEKAGNETMTTTDVTRDMLSMRYWTPGSYGEKPDQEDDMKWCLLRS